MGRTERLFQGSAMDLADLAQELSFQYLRGAWRLIAAACPSEHSAEHPSPFYYLINS